MSVRPPCDLCGVSHRENEDGIIECRNRLTEQRDEWKDLAGELRVQASRISGVLMDLDWASPDSMSASLETIEQIINGPWTTSPQSGGPDGSAK